MPYEGKRLYHPGAPRPTKQGGHMWKKEGDATVTAKELSTEGTKDGEIIAFVGKGVTFRGAISYEGTVRIDGRVDGEIETTGTLIVGEDAVITAKVHAGTVVSKGKITGDVVAKERVKLMAPAMLNGSVKAPVFSIEEGVTFDGSCEMTGAEVHNLQEARQANQSTTNAKRMIG
jgi:cytoskeletal protein CcmA (bactofilin family)